MSDEFKDFATPKSDAQRRTTPYNDLDAQFLVTEPAWGREGSKGLYAALSKKEFKTLAICQDCSQPFGDQELCQHCESEHKALMIQSESLWDLMSYYTRDLRLGYLSRSEGRYCSFWLGVAGDLLRVGHINSFLAALSRVIDTIELSQSRNGFFRKRQNTVTSERFENPLSDDSKKKDLFTGKSKNNNMRY